MNSHERILGYITFLLTVSFQLIVPILPVYLYSVLGASKQEVGVIIALAAIASALTRIPSSIFVMRENALKVLVFGIGLNTVALLGYTLSVSPWMLAFFRILHGASFALNYTLMLSFVSLFVRPDRAYKSITNYTASIAMGLWVGPAIGVFLNSFLDLKMLMLSATLISLAPVFLGGVFLKNRSSFWEDIYYSKMRVDVFKALLKKPLLLPTALYLFYSMVVGALLAYAPLKAKISFGISDQLIIFIFTGYYFITFLLRTILSRSTLQMENTKLLRLAMASCALGVFVAGLAPTLWLFVMGTSLVAIAHGLTFPLTAMITAHVVPPNFRIIGNSIYLTSWDIGSIFGPIVVASILYVAPLPVALAFTSIFAGIALLLTGKIAQVIG